MKLYRDEKLKVFCPGQTVSAVILIIVMTGCAGSMVEPHIQRKNGLTIMSTTADVEGLLIKDSGSTEEVCAGRNVMVADTSQFSLGVTTPTATSENISTGSGAISLGGINPATHIISELMYRTCELSLNLDLTKNESLELYKDVLEVLVEVSTHYKSSSISDTGTPAAVAPIEMNPAAATETSSN